METIYNKIISGLITISISFASLFGAGGGVATQQDVKKVKEEIKIETSQESDMKLGSISFVAGKTYYLYGGGIGSSDTSITLTAFKTPVSNYNLVMSNFGTTGYVTIEPANTTRQEIVSFTGITQNADGTATLTGATRGLSPVSPYTASTTIQKAHSGGSVVVISNPPQLYDSFPAKSNAETITGSWSFPLTPTIDANPASKKYVDDTAFSGAGVIDATATARGVVEISTGLETASSTATGSSGTLAIPASLATSTYNSATASLKVVVTQNNGKIDSYFIATTTLGIYNNVTLTGTTTAATCVGCGNNPIIIPATQIGSSTPTAINGLSLGPDQGFYSTATSTFFYLGDTQHAVLNASVQVPDWATQLTSIKVLYARMGTGNVKSLFQVSYASSTYPTTPTVDSTTETFAGTGTDQQIDSHTVPTAAFNSINSVSSGGIINFFMGRDANDGGIDTYNNPFRVYGVEFTFN